MDSAAERLADLNPDVRVIPIEQRLSAVNARDVIGQFDLVVDGSDNFPTRYLVNDVCVWLDKPLVYGSIFRFEGQASVFHATRGPCYRCLYAEPPPPHLVPSCAEGGVLGVLPGVIGSLQALEAIKLVLGAGEPLVGRLVVFDALRLVFRQLGLRKDPDCPVCGSRPSITEPIDYEAFCGIGGQDAASADEISATELAELLESRSAAVQVLDVREPWEWEIARLPQASLVPLGELAGRLGEVDPRAEIVTLCHHGARSAQAGALLKAAGFSRVRSLAGGIDRWAREIDPGMGTY